MDNSTISMAMFNSYVSHYQRVWLQLHQEKTIWVWQILGEIPWFITKFYMKSATNWGAMYPQDMAHYSFTQKLNRFTYSMLDLTGVYPANPMKKFGSTLMFTHLQGGAPQLWVGL